MSTDAARTSGAIEPERDSGASRPVFERDTEQSTDRTPELDRQAAGKLDEIKKIADIPAETAGEPVPGKAEEPIVEGDQLTETEVQSATGDEIHGGVGEEPLSGRDDLIEVEDTAVAGVGSLTETVEKLVDDGEKELGAGSDDLPEAEEEPATRADIPADLEKKPVADGVDLTEPEDTAVASVGFLTETEEKLIDHGNEEPGVGSDDLPETEEELATRSHSPAEIEQTPVTSGDDLTETEERPADGGGIPGDVGEESITEVDREPSDGGDDLTEAEKATAASVGLLAKAGSEPSAEVDDLSDTEEGPAAGADIHTEIEEKPAGGDEITADIGDESVDVGGDPREPTTDIDTTLAGISSLQTGLTREEKKRRLLLLSLLVLSLLIVGSGITIWRYLEQPAPLPELLGVPANLNYAPHYLFSIHGITKPVGVALSPEEDRIYVAETGGERQVRVFDRDGGALGAFAPPHTLPSERSPVYLAVDGRGRVFVTDRLQHAVFVYDREGKLQDILLGPDQTLSEYVASTLGESQVNATLAYNLFERAVYCRSSDGNVRTLPAPAPAEWSPLGIRVDGEDNLLLTDVIGDRHIVRLIPHEAMGDAPWQEFDPPDVTMGRYGRNDGELMFPNTAVADSLDRIYVTDGNNGRIAVWNRLGLFLFNFGQGVGEEAFGLPRGAAIDARDRLHVVDAVEQKVKVYTISGSEPHFLFAFGEWGAGRGQFNFPNDIALDSTGRLYIADRENNRIQVWSY